MGESEGARRVDSRPCEAAATDCSICFEIRVSCKLAMYYLSVLVACSSFIRTQYIRRLLAYCFSGSIQLVGGQLHIPGSRNQRLSLIAQHPLNKVEHSTLGLPL